MLLLQCGQTISSSSPVAAGTAKSQHATWIVARSLQFFRQVLGRTFSRASMQLHAAQLSAKGLSGSRARLAMDQKP